MPNVVAWPALLTLIGVAELVWAPRCRGADSPSGAATDRLMQLLTVVAIVGPPLSALIQRSAPGAIVSSLGIVLSLTGIALRVVAMRTLGDRFQLTPRRVADAPHLIRTGPYAVVRHPGYTALLLAFGGLALIGGGFLGLLFVAPLVLGVSVRIAIEEAPLREEFGTLYTDYVRETPWMLLPRIR